MIRDINSILIKRSRKQHDMINCNAAHARKKHADWAFEIVNNVWEKGRGLSLSQAHLNFYQESKSIFESFKKIHFDSCHTITCNTCKQMQNTSENFFWLHKVMFKEPSKTKPRTLKSQTTKKTKKKTKKRKVKGLKPKKTNLDKQSYAETNFIDYKNFDVRKMELEEKRLEHIENKK